MARVLYCEGVTREGQCWCRRPVPGSVLRKGLGVGRAEKSIESQRRAVDAMPTAGREGGRGNGFGEVEEFGCNSNRIRIRRSRE